MSGSRQSVKRQEKDPYPFEPMCTTVVRIYLYLMIFAFPLLMNSTKYGAITAFKGTLFYVLFLVTAATLCAAGLLSSLTSVTATTLSSESIKQKLMQPPFIADCALLVYWFFALISTIFAEDAATAFLGLSPRNNGFVIQTFYIATYFIISYGLKPKKTDALAFAWGGAVLSGACMLHFFGVDLYNIAAVNGEAYGGPFYNVSGYKFMGPVGNVNLGSYILTICCVLAAALYIAGVRLEFDKKNAITLACFGLCLWAELNINTDAGLVALLAAFLVAPFALCINYTRVKRFFGVLSVAAFVLLFDKLIVGVILNGETFGKKGVLLCAALAAAGLAWAALCFCERYEKFSKSVVFTKKYLTIISLAAVGVLLVGGVSAALAVTERDDIATGSITGAYYKLDAHDYNDHTKGVFKEFGNMLRGNFDDSFGHNRLFTWKRSLELAGLRPVFGLGLDNFKANFAEYFGDEAEIMFPSSGGGVDKAHNEYLDVLVDNGAVGLICQLAFFGALLYYLLRERKKALLAPVFAVAVCAYMVHAFFGYQLPLQSPFMWMMIAMAGCSVRQQMKNEKRNAKS